MASHLFSLWQKSFQFDPPVNCGVRWHTLLYYINSQYSEHEVQLQELRPRGTDGSRVQSVYYHILAAVTLGLKFQSCNSEDWTL